jgi:hypothetical protein
MADSRLDGNVTIPRRLAYRIWGLLAQECSPCASEECWITKNPEQAIDDCVKQLCAALDATSAGVRPVEAPSQRRPTWDEEIMAAADKYWEASTAARYRVRAELEAVVKRAGVFRST